jgi:tetratricopeptide (TPR) repeat protein
LLLKDSCILIHGKPPLTPPERLINLLRTNMVRFQLVLVLLLGIVAYANSFTVPLQYDDVMVLRKSVDGSLKLGFRGGLRWVADLTFSLNRLAHGEHVAGYHAVNLAIHLSAAVCLYYLVLSSMAALRSSFGLSAEREGRPFLQNLVPFATAAIFVCHPVQTQAVTYIAQRYASLATLFYLASLLAYIKARIHRTGPPAWSWGAAALVMSMLAIMSKEIAFTLPLMAVVLEIMLFRGRLLRSPLFLALGAALMLIIPLQLLHKSGVHGFSDILSGLQRATVEVQEISRRDYFLTQLRVIVTYLRLLILPVNQNLDYDYPIQHSLFAPQVLASLTLHLSIAISALLLFIRSRSSLLTGNSSVGIALRLASLGIVWFYLALTVESSIIPIRDVIGEHRLYLPSAGIIMAAFCLAAALADRAKSRTPLWWLVAVCCLVFTTATVARNRVWNSQLGIWMDVLAKSPNKARAHYQVGFNLAQRSMPDKALPHLVRAIELTPGATDFWIVLNSAVPCLGTFDGRYDSGLKYHQMVFSIDPRYLVPWQAVSYNNLGLAYEYLGNYRAARTNFEKAAIVDPSLDLAWLNLAVISAKLRDPAGFAMALGRLQATNPSLARSKEALLTFSP